MKNNNFEDKVINYTDTTGILMDSVKTIVNAVSYVLIGFVSISLVVSSIMIGITLQAAEMLFVLRTLKRPLMRSLCRYLNWKQ